MISRDFVLQKANKSQIDKYTTIREYFQLVFLRYFYDYSQEVVKSYFKGGTAIRFLFHSFRFSEDLDFTCVGEMKGIKRILLGIIPDIEQETGFKVLIKDEKIFAGVGVGYRLVLQPNDLLRQPLGVRLDFSFREKPIMPKTTAISVTDYPISPFPLVMHLGKDEIVAEKVRAILAREAPRDIFDLWFLLKQGVEINWSLVRTKMAYYPKIAFSQAILKKRIKTIGAGALKRDLNQFLPQNYRNYVAKIPGELEVLIK